MNIIFDQIPMPPSENHLFPTNFHTKMRYESQEYREYKKRFLGWGLKRCVELKPLLDQLKWELADHRKMIRVDSFFFFQYSELFTKPTKQNERPRRKEMDVHNKVKALYDCLSSTIGIDDRRFFPGFCEPVLRLEGPGMYVRVHLTLELIREEKDVLVEMDQFGAKIY